MTISACVGWTVLYGEICWGSLGPHYDNEPLAELFLIDGIKTKVITHHQTPPPDTVEVGTDRAIVPRK